MAYLTMTIGVRSFEFELLTDDAPETIRWLAAVALLETDLAHAMWSGQACVAPLATAAPPTLESPIASVYPGYALVVPGAAAETGAGTPAHVIGYGEAELRDGRGRVYGSPVARLVGSLEELRTLLVTVRSAGAARLAIGKIQ